MQFLSRILQRYRVQFYRKRVNRLNKQRYLNRNEYEYVERGMTSPLGLQQQLKIIIGVLHDVLKCNFVLFILDQLKCWLLCQQNATHLQVAPHHCSMQSGLSALVLQQKISLVLDQ